MTRTAVEPGSVGIGPLADGPKTTPVEHEGLCERLEASLPVGPIDSDGFSIGGWARANPDGPEAATLIRTQAAELERLRGALRLALPHGVCLTNGNVPDSQVVCLDATMGNLREIARALSDTPPEKNGTQNDQ